MSPWDQNEGLHVGYSQSADVPRNIMGTLIARITMTAAESRRRGTYRLAFTGMVGPVDGTTWGDQSVTNTHKKRIVPSATSAARVFGRATDCLQHSGEDESVKRVYRVPVETSGQAVRRELRDLLDARTPVRPA